MKKIISFIAGDGGNLHFVNPVINYLTAFHEVRVYQEPKYDDADLQKILNESDLVWFEWGNGPVIPASRLNKKAITICRIHRYEILGNEIKAVNWKNIDHVIFVNKEFHLLFKELVYNKIDEDSQVHIIPNVIAGVEPFKERTSGFNIAYISRFHPDKNPGLMIQVLKKLVEHDNHYKIFMAGGVQDLQLYLYCKHLIKDMNLQNNFLYEGTISNINNWLGDKNYFLSTSIVEAHPVSVSEAMMQGIKPVLHNSFGKLGDVFDKKFLFNTPEEAVKLITEKDYASAVYRQFAVDKFGEKKVLSSIKKLIDNSVGTENISNIQGHPCKYPFVTIAILTYNRANFLSEAINSALSQEGNYEVLIADDASTDNTQSIIENYNSGKIKYFKNEKNLGRPKTRNRVIKEASGDYILWLGDDDILLPGVLREYSELIKNDPSIDVAYGNIQAFDQETGKDIALFSANDYTSSTEKLLMNLVLGSGITDGGSLIKKSLYEQFGGYDEEYLRAQDNELWSRIGLHAKFHKVKRTIYRYRKHDNNVSFGNFIDSSYESRTIRRILNRNPLKKIFPGLSFEDSLLLTAKGLSSFDDWYNAKKIIRKFNLTSSSQALELYLNCLVNTGTLEGLEQVWCNKSWECYRENVMEKVSILTSFRNEISQLLSKKDYLSARDKIQSTASKVGYTFDVVYNLARLLAEVKESKLAEGYFKLAVKLNPGDEEVFKTAFKNISGETERKNLHNMRSRLLEDIPLFDEQKTNQNIEQHPCVSVIITTYNREEKLAEAVKSVLSQKYQNFEIIVVNDAGDDVSEIINQFNDNSIRLITHDKNKGQAAARNTGLKAAKGKYIAFLDDDDIFYPEHLSTAIENLNDGNKVIYTDAVRCTIENKDGINKIVNKTIPYSIDYSRNKLLVANIAPVNCFVFEKELVELAGLCDETLNVLEDWEFWLRLSAFTEFKHVKKNTVQVNWFNDGSTMTATRRQSFETVRNQIYTKYQDEINAIPNVNEIAAEFNNIWKNDFAPGTPLVSIIALSYNQVEYTKAFVESVLHNTNVPYEMIIIDNNSNRETIKYLEELAVKASNIRVIFNKENAGFPKGVNQGIKSSNGQYILIANNDILVTEDWLTGLIEVAQSRAEIGIVGPVSNCVSGVQLDRDANYSTIEEMFSYAGKIRTKNAGKMFEFPRVAFLCTLIKKEVIEKIGGLDERFTPGNFEDDDFCLRTQLAGYKTVVAQDVFVHHFGSKSFTAEGTEKYASRLEVNKKKFVDKWGADPEEIWLHGKKVVKRNLFYPISSNLFSENFRRALLQIEDKEYSPAIESLRHALENYKYKDDTPVTIDEINSLIANLNIVKENL